MVRVGVLGFQGAYARHLDCVGKLGHSAVKVTTVEHLQNCSHLILPGGESSTLLKLLNADLCFKREFARFLAEKPVFGTCAGAILLATGVHNPEQESFSAIDIDVERNGYGRQLDSFICEDLEALSPGQCAQKHGVFIRAPRITRLGPTVKALTRYQNEVVSAYCKNILVTTFHPELTDDLSVYDFFIAFR